MNYRRKNCIRFILHCSCFILFFSIFACSPLSVFASGEIAFVRAPEEIPEGDDVTVIVSASARETNIDRTLAIQYPAGWKLKRAWGVESGSDHAVTISRFDEVTAMLSKESGHEAVALADYSDNFDPDAAGMAYFIVFSTKPVAGKASTETGSIKAALIERTDPDAPPEIDPKNKKKIPADHNWRMTYPSRYDFSFAEITSKRLIASVTIERVPKAERALVLDGTKYAMADLNGRTELLRDYFQHPFSIQCWFRTTGYDQKLLRMQTENGNEIQLDIGILGQPTILVAGRELRSILTSKAITNDGAWHNLVFSKDSVGNLRLFVDAQPPATEHTTLPILDGIVNLTIGDSSKTSKDFSIDELRFLNGAYKDPADFTHGMMIAYRDTSHRAFAIFHFDDYTSVARSSVNETSPLFFTLDSSAFLRETASPVEAEPATLSADLSSPTKVAITWQTSSELGVKQYILERRAGPYGPFEKALTLDAKHGIKVPKRGQSVVSRNVYHATEELPQLKGDIDLYYRIALVGFNEKDPPIYTFPVKLEYAPNRDVFVEQNEPNPFNTITSIAFRLTKPESVRLSIFDMIGREVIVLADEKLATGRHSYDLDAKDWPQGIYFYKVKTNSATVTRKMVLLK
jgi:hypothetical protein